MSSNCANTIVLERAQVQHDLHGHVFEIMLPVQVCADLGNGDHVPPESIPLQRLKYILKLGEKAREYIDLLLGNTGRQSQGRRRRALRCGACGKFERFQARHPSRLNLIEDELIRMDNAGETRVEPHFEEPTQQLEGVCAQRALAASLHAHVRSPRRQSCPVLCALSGIQQGKHAPIDAPDPAHCQRTRVKTSLSRSLDVSKTLLLSQLLLW